MSWCLDVHVPMCWWLLWGVDVLVDVFVLKLCWWIYVLLCWYVWSVDVHTSDLTRRESEKREKPVNGFETLFSSSRSSLCRLSFVQIRKYKIPNIRVFCCDGTTFDEFPPVNAVEFANASGIHDSCLTSRTLKRKRQKLKKKLDKSARGNKRSKTDLGDTSNFKEIVIQREFRGEGSSHRGQWSVITLVTMVNSDSGQHLHCGHRVTVIAVTRSGLHGHSGYVWSIVVNSLWYMVVRVLVVYSDHCDGG